MRLVDTVVAGYFRVEADGFHQAGTGAQLGLQGHGFRGGLARDYPSA